MYVYTSTCAVLDVGVLLRGRACRSAAAVSSKPSPARRARDISSRGAAASEQSWSR